MGVCSFIKTHGTGTGCNFPSSKSVTSLLNLTIREKRKTKTSRIVFLTISSKGSFPLAVFQKKLVKSKRKFLVLLFNVRPLNSEVK